jgi:hypothetical protein
MIGRENERKMKGKAFRGEHHCGHGNFTRSYWQGKDPLFPRIIRRELSEQVFDDVGSNCCRKFEEDFFAIEWKW